MNTFQYDFDEIVKKGDLIEERRNQIFKINNTIYGMNNSIIYNGNDYSEDPYGIPSVTPNCQTNDESIYQGKLKILLSDRTQSNRTINDKEKYNKYIYSNNGRSIEMKRGENDEKKCAFYSKELLPSEGIVEMTYIIRSKAHTIFVGFAVEGDLNRLISNKQEESWCVYILAGRIKNLDNNDMHFAKHWHRPETEEYVFTLYFDHSTDEIWVKVDDILKQEKFKINITAEQKKKLVAGVEFRCDEKITFY
jgi:hypothetical protein